MGIEQFIFANAVVFVFHSSGTYVRESVYGCYIGLCNNRDWGYALQGQVASSLGGISG